MGDFVYRIELRHLVCQEVERLGEAEPTAAQLHPKGPRDTRGLTRGQSAAITRARAQLNAEWAEWSEAPFPPPLVRPRSPTTLRAAVQKNGGRPRLRLV